MPERQFGAAVQKRPHGLLRIHVLLAHEPTRFVSPDRQYRETEWTICRTRRAEIMSLTVTRIRDVIDTSGRGFDHERRPQGFVTVEHMARRPVPHRRKR